MIGVLALSAGCKKSETPAAENQPAASQPAASTAANALPQVCSDYLDKATACYKKAGPQFAQAAQAIEQSKATWSQQLSAANYDKAALESACKTASDAFDKMKPMLKCD